MTGDTVPAAGQAPVRRPPGYVLTVRQHAILRIIRRSVRDRGYPPSLREIAEAAGLDSTSSVAYQLDVLQRRGFLVRERGKPRAMEVRMPGEGPAREPDEAHEAAAAAIPAGWVEAAEARYSMHGSGLIRNILAGAEPLIRAAERERIRQLAERNGAVCTGDEGTQCWFADLIREVPS